MISTRWTTKDLERFSDDDGTRYEIIDGELYMSKQPHMNHQVVCSEIVRLLGNWNKQTTASLVTTVPGIIFSNDNDVVPDVIWISKARRAASMQPDGKLQGAPELAIEVLSPGTANENRDYEAKRGLYSRQGVNEYWIVSWPERRVEIFRRDQNPDMLELTQTLYAADTLTSPELPGFACQVNDIFTDVV